MHGRKHKEPLCARASCDRGHGARALRHGRACLRAGCPIASLPPGERLLPRVHLRQLLIAVIIVRFPLQHPRRVLAWVLLLLALLGTLAAPAATAQERAWRDAALWTGAGTTLVAAVLLDHAIRAEWAAAAVGDEWSALSMVGTHGGRARYAFPVLGAVYLTGRLSDEDELATAAAHTAAALLAAGVVNGVLKVGIGRLRPDAEGRAGEFRPISTDDQWQSFPSGHAVVAFSLAAAISEQADRPWVSVLTYGTAAVVGWSRIYEDRHWASDVVGGAIVGIAVSKFSIRWLNARARHQTAEEGVKVALLPGGLAVSIPAP